MPPESRNNKKRHYCRQLGLGIETRANFLTDLQGIFVTSAVSDKHTIASQAFRILKQYTDAIPNALEQQEHRFEKLTPGAKGTLFIYWPKIQGQDTPQQVCFKLQAKRREGYNFDAISTFYPVNGTCRTEPREMEEKFEHILGLLGDAQFYCEVKVRNNNGITKSEVLEMIRQISHGAMLEEPEEACKVLSVQICQCNCMIGWYENEA